MGNRTRVEGGSISANVPLRCPEHDDETVVDHQGPDGISIQLNGFTRDFEVSISCLVMTTERPLENPWFDLYRHPKTQSTVPREGRNDSKNRTMSTVWGCPVRARSVEADSYRVRAGSEATAQGSGGEGCQDTTSIPQGISTLKSEAGDVFAGIVKFCPSAEAVDDQTLQLEFWENVVTVFDGILV
ncbi:uncharacterized protein G6M90_00g062670 [Metarhizium brunneum]|uniref:Uncharacterized protein n=1 Tax=Metarhizium brunneum TaxID=500148 RepID=A0A7D5UYD2_9HYPO|nr:hypothetical protein G6M90_00g062670 [Metarhizium brunneum]